MKSSSSKVLKKQMCFLLAGVKPYLELVMEDNISDISDPGKCKILDKVSVSYETQDGVQRTKVLLWRLS